MVVTDGDLEDLPPAERVKALRELRDQKRKELEDVRKRKEEEIRETESRLEDSLEELEREEAEVAEAALDEDEGGEEQEAEGSSPESLEGAVAGASGETPAQLVYGIPMPGSLEELSDYNLYSEVRRLEDKTYLTSEEQRRIAELRGRAADITEAYSTEQREEVDRQRGNYLSRTEQALRRLNERLHDVSGATYDLNRRDDDAVYQ